MSNEDGLDTLHEGVDAFQAGVVGAKFSADEFQELLDNAASEVRNAWEVGFVSNLRSKYVRFGLNTFISNGQLSTLRSIAYGK